MRPSSPCIPSSIQWRGWRGGLLLAALLGAGALLAQESTRPVTEPAREAPSASGAQGSIVQEWLDSRPELEKEETACVMCAGFGGAIVCGLGCDATGLTIRKADGSENPWCGRCVQGEWKK